MSSLLNEAIIDAKALRESALQNAEAAIIDKYSDEVKNALDRLLEQEIDEVPPMGDIEAPLDTPPPVEAPLDLGAEEGVESLEDVTEDDVPLAATNGLSHNEGDNLSSMPQPGEDVQVTIDLGALQEAVAKLADSLEEDEEIDVGPLLDEEDAITIDDPAAAQKADDEDMKGLANLAEEGDAPLDALVDAVMEKLEVDTGFELSGWAGRPTSQLKLGQERELAGAESTPTESVDEETELDKELQESIIALEGEKNSLQAQLDKYKHAIAEIKENLYEVNLSNARLLYTNRVLRNTSLNERQKDKIVEAISSAGSVSEAKTIFETLQSTVESTPKRGPQSLGEVISRRSSVIRATRQESQPSDTFSDRMRRLAGIK